MSSNIVVAHDFGTTTVTIFRPEKKNSITQEMYAALAAAIKDYGENDSSRAFVITGDGDIFTAGNDLNDFAKDGDASEDLPVVEFLLAIKDCPKPIIAAVNGAAIGVGLTMLLHCDLVVAAQSASFSAPFALLGLVPEAASSMLLPATVGMAVASDMLLTGRSLSSQEALQFGLISRVLADEGFAENVAELAKSMADLSPRALRLSKELIRNQKDAVADHMKLELAIFQERLSSPDFAESVLAMKEKRPPRYE